MGVFLTWLETLPVSTTIAESQSIWGFALVLFLHSLGMALTVGTTTMMSLRIIGFAGSVPLSSLRPLFRFFWAGFILNAITGTLLFMMAATTEAYQPLFYGKMTFLVLAVLAMRPIRAVIESDRAIDGVALPSRVKTMAALSLVCWVGVITSGRLIAYFPIHTH